MQNQQHPVTFEARMPQLAQRGISESTWSALKNSLFIGGSDDSILMAIDYCLARNLDIMLKPVHIVPMSVKMPDGTYEYRDTIMPSIGLYRIQADRSGTYAGADEPRYGPTVTYQFGNGNTQINVPEYCKYTVHKIVGDRVVIFTTTEYWIENYATQSRNTDIPNAMWSKRPFAQLAKCAEAQALRKAFPEVGQIATAEEMIGKDFAEEKVINPMPQTQAAQPDAIEHQADDANALPLYPDDKFQANLIKWQQVISSGRKTVESMCVLIESKGMALTEQQKQQLSQGVTA